MGVVVLKDLFKGGEVVEWEIRAFVVDEAALEVENEGVFGDVEMLAVLVATDLEGFVEVLAAEGFEAADIMSGDLFDAVGVAFGGEVEFVDYSLFMVVSDDFGEDPGVHVDAVRDGFKVDFLAVDVVVVGDFCMKAGDAVFGFGEFDGEGAEFEATTCEKAGDPATEGGAGNVREDEAVELLDAEFRFGGLDEGVVGIEGVFADVDEGFVEVHAVAAELVEASDCGEDGGGFVKLDDCGFDAEAFLRPVAAEAEGNHLIKSVVAGAVASIKFAEIWFAHSEESGGAEDFLVDV